MVTLNGFGASDGTVTNGFDGKGAGIDKVAGLAVDPDDPPKINGVAVGPVDNAGGGAPKTGVEDGDDGGKPKPDDDAEAFVVDPPKLNSGVAVVEPKDELEVDVVGAPNGAIVLNGEEPNGALVPNAAVAPKLGVGFVELNDVEGLPLPKVNGEGVAAAAAAGAAEVVDVGVKPKPPPVEPNTGAADDDEAAVDVGIGLKPLLMAPNVGAAVDVGFKRKPAVLGEDVIVEEVLVDAGVTPKPPTPNGEVVVVDCVKLKLLVPNGGTAVADVVVGVEVEAEAPVPNEGVAVAIVVVAAGVVPNVLVPKGLGAGVVPKVMVPNGDEDADVVAIDGDVKLRALVVGKALVVVDATGNEGVGVVVVVVEGGFVNELDRGSEFPSLTEENTLGVNVNAGKELVETVVEAGVTVVVVDVPLPNVPNVIVDAGVAVTIEGVLVVVDGVAPNAGNVDVPN